MNFKEILVDSNLLVLLVVGLTSRELITRHKRTKIFEQDDYDLLVKILSSYDVIVVTPHVLAETSNLVSQIGEPALEAVRLTFSKLIQDQKEVYYSSRDSVKHPAFVRLGLTDASILQLAKSAIPLLTTDVGLYLEAYKLNSSTINFNHLRQQRLLEP